MCMYNVDSFIRSNRFILVRVTVDYVTITGGVDGIGQKF